MRRWLNLSVLITALGAMLAVAQEPALKKKEVVPEKVDLNPKDEKTPAPKEEAAEDKTAELVARIHKNMEASRDRLDQKDPGNNTRQLQRDIVQDLDELIEQQKKQDQQNQSQSSSSSSSSRRKLSQKQKSQDQKQKDQEQKSAKNKEQPDPQKQPAGSKKEELAQKKPQDKNQDNAKDKTAQQGKDKKDQKDQMAKTGGRKGNSQNNNKNTLAELYRDIWGHLPATKRQEMDAYARERFMREYEDLLRQYYRTIAEQDRRSEGD